MTRSRPFRNSLIRLAYAVGALVLLVACNGGSDTATPAPTTAAATATAPPAVAATATSVPIVAATASPTPALTATPSPTATPTLTPSPTPTPTNTASPTSTPSPTPSPTPEPTMAPTEVFEVLTGAQFPADAFPAGFPAPNVTYPDPGQLKRPDEVVGVIAVISANPGPPPEMNRVTMVIFVSNGAAQDEWNRMSLGDLGLSSNPECGATGAGTTSDGTPYAVSQCFLRATPVIAIVDSVVYGAGAQGNADHAKALAEATLDYLASVIGP